MTRDSEATEEQRRSFRPANVRVLFVGESAPAGPTFFYDGNSNLYRHMRVAIDEVTGTADASPVEFLDRFRELGFYLDDLCLEPVNSLPRSERKARCIAAEETLAQRIAEYAPEVVVAIGKTFAAPSIKRALARSGVVARFEVVPFPNWPDQQKTFKERVVELARELLA